MIAPNTIVGGRYRVVRPLGGGGMKMVYLAEDLRLASRPCALAEMVDSLTSPDQQRQALTSFQREAEMLAQLSNEHIPRVFDSFSEQNRHYLVMEYIEGITLEQKLHSAGGKLPESEVIAIALQICDTLHYLHNLSPPVIYRDLKPSNVMLTASGQAKLIDFGIARHFQPQFNATMIGTQGYAPPEQYRGRVETRSDLYALGATMHHALSGRDPAAEPPFSFPPLRTACPGVTPALADLVDQALQYDVVLRVVDVGEFRARLLAIKSGVVPVITPVTSTPALQTPATGEASRPQLRLPLGAPGSPPVSSPSAPTVLSNAIDTPCPRCGRRIPADSRYCSFCAAEVHFELRADQVAADAPTRSLGDFPGPSPLPQSAPEPGRHDGHGVRRFVWPLAGLFIGAFILTSVFVQRALQPREPTGMPAPDMGPSMAPDSGGIEPTTRLQALRRELDADGYTNVHFRLDGDTLILWGTVPTEEDRFNVRFIVFRVTQIVSMVDHLQARESFAMP